MRPDEFAQEMGYVQRAFDEMNPFGRAEVHVESPLLATIVLQCEVADNDATRTRGMIGRTFPEGVDAMLFAYQQPVQHAFHMHGVVVQLHMAFYDAAGALVDHAGAFTSDPWAYKPSAAYQWVVELPVEPGQSFDWLTGSRLVTTGLGHQQSPT